MVRLFVLLILMVFHLSLFSNRADVVVFSYDRPLQLYAFLESLDHHACHIHETSVIYRCSSLEYRAAYDKVFCAFPQVRGIEQKSPPQDFKHLLIQAAFESEATEYVAFAVDDMIVTDHVDFSECIHALETTHAYGFFLRLGRNIEDCWSSGNLETIPPLIKIEENIYFWEFNAGVGNWAYPNTVDMTIYRKKDIEEHLRREHYFNPNTLEDRFGAIHSGQSGLCYETSRAVNIPLNIVSHTTATNHLNISTGELLKLFNAGWKMDISPLFQYRNKSAHVFTYSPTFLNLSQ